MYLVPPAPRHRPAGAAAAELSEPRLRVRPLPGDVPFRDGERDVAQAEGSEGVIEDQAGRLGPVSLASRVRLADVDAEVRAPVAVGDVHQLRRADGAERRALVDHEGGDIVRRGDALEPRGLPLHRHRAEGTE